MSSKLYTNDALNLSRLPQWAQKHIEALQRERDSAIHTLNEFCASEKPGPYVFETWACTGEEQGPSTKVHYAHGHNMTVKHLGLELRVGLREDGIHLQYNTERSVTGDVTLRPTSFQALTLVADGVAELGNKLFKEAQNTGALIGLLEARMSQCLGCGVGECSQCLRDREVIAKARKS